MVSLCSVVMEKGVRSNNKVRVEGNHHESSKSMEPKAVILAMKKVKDIGLLPLLRSVCVDEDSTTAALFRGCESKYNVDELTGEPLVDLTHITVCTDAGHFAKNVQKHTKNTMNACKKQKRFKNNNIFSSMPPRIKLRLLRIIVEAREEVSAMEAPAGTALLYLEKIIRERWAQTPKHYVQKCDPVICRCGERRELSHTDLYYDTKEDMDTELKRLTPDYLDLDNKDHKGFYHFVLLPIVAHVAKNTHKLVHNLNTCLCESHNNKRLSYAPKRIHFPVTYKYRANMNDLLTLKKRAEIADMLFAHFILQKLPDDELWLAQVQRGDSERARVLAQQRTADVRLRKNMIKCINRRIKVDECKADDPVHSLAHGVLKDTIDVPDAGPDTGSRSAATRTTVRKRRRTQAMMKELYESNKQKYWCCPLCGHFLERAAVSQHKKLKKHKVAQADAELRAVHAERAATRTEAQPMVHLSM